MNRGLNRTNKICVLLLALVFCLALAACGEEPAESVGEYTCVRAMAGGRELEVEALFPAGASLKLDADGQGILTVDGETGRVRWTQIGEAIVLSAGEVSVKGSLINGVMTLQMNSGAVLTFTAPGVQLPPTEPADLGRLACLLGEWQGWWTIGNASGVYSTLNGPGQVCYARSVADADGNVRILFWDDDSSADAPVAWAEFTAGAEGTAENSSGFIMGYWIKPGAWRIDLDRVESENTVRFSGRVEAEDGAFDYTMDLRLLREGE